MFGEKPIHEWTGFALLNGAGVVGAMSGESWLAVGTFLVSAVTLVIRARNESPAPELRAARAEADSLRAALADVRADYRALVDRLAPPPPRPAAVPIKEDGGV